MLYYQDIAVFRNDFISRVEPVHTQTLTYATAGSTATKFDVSAVATGDLAGKEAHLLIRGSDGVQYRYPITAINASDYDVTSSGSFFDPEQNKLVARVPANDALFTDGQDMIVAERLDGSTIYCGCWGEYKGVAGFTSANNAGLRMSYVGQREDENAHQYRMVWYVGFDLYNRLALARMSDVLPLGS